MKKLILLIVLIIILSINYNAKEIPINDNTHIQVLYFDKLTNTFYAKGYDNYTYGLDSCVHKIEIKKGTNKYYFVFFNKSIELTIIEYDE